MRIPRSLLLASVVTLGVASGACSSNATQPATDAGDAATSAPDAAAPLMTDGQLRDAVRALWTDRVMWTRFYVMEAIAKSPATDAAAARLMQNQVDIGDAMRPFYGDAAANQLTTLLRQGVTDAGATVAAAGANDMTAFAAAKAKWYADGDEVAKLLAGANPNWALADLQALIRGCSDDLLAEASARLAGDWSGDVAAYDKIDLQAQAMADAIAAGLAKQFPGKVATSPDGPKVQALHVGMRVLWMQRTAWLRDWLVATIGKGADANAAAQRLMKNQADMGDAIKPFYGDAAGAQLTTLLQQGVTDAGATVAAAMAGDMNAFTTAKAKWYDDGDQVAHFLASANPAWSEADLKTAIHTCFDDALAEATARMKGDWKADVAAHDTIVKQARAVADTLSDGVAKQFPDKLK